MICVHVVNIFVHNKTVVIHLRKHVTDEYFLQPRSYENAPDSLKMHFYNIYLFKLYRVGGGHFLVGFITHQIPRLAHYHPFKTKP